LDRILVGTDGSPDGQGAVRWAAVLAAATNAELIVLTAWVPDASEMPPEMYDERRADAQSRLGEWIAATGARAQPLLLDGDPREALLRGADDVNADLVVIGTRGTGRRHHTLHLGSVAHHLVHETTRPLATAPVSARAAWPAPVLVGVDGSEHSDKALGWAISLAASVGGEVIATYAELAPAEFVPHDDPKSWYQRALRDVDKWLAPVDTRGVSVRSLVVDHEPGPGIAEAADDEQAGLIVVGARGIGRVSGVRLGSVALKVLHHAHLPVIIVP
jgi:nucleotide-binding universal stress UspA family protein